MQREACLAQINATVEAAKQMKKAAKAKKKSGTHKKATNRQPKAAEAQAIPETGIRRSARTMKGKGHPAPEDIDLGNEQDIDLGNEQDIDDNFLAPLGSDHEGSAAEFDVDPLQEHQKGKGKKSSAIPPYSLHPDDPAAFLSLAAFLNIFLAESVEEKKLQKADTLVRVYCKDLIRVSISPLPLHLLIKFRL